MFLPLSKRKQETPSTTITHHSSPHPATSQSIQSFRATNAYADVIYTVDFTTGVLTGTVEFFNLQGNRTSSLLPASAVHIHTNNNGSSGPIIVWLATSNHWNQGVTQGTPGSNGPCCIVGKEGCTLQSPPDTPCVGCASNKKYSFSSQRSSFCGPTTSSSKTSVPRGPTRPSSHPPCQPCCPWVDKGAFLDVHGYNFQTVVNGCLTSGTPGLDMMVSTPFQQIS